MTRGGPVDAKLETAKSTPTTTATVMPIDDLLSSRATRTARHPTTRQPVKIAGRRIRVAATMVQVEGKSQQ